MSKAGWLLLGAVGAILVASRRTPLALLNPASANINRNVWSPEQEAGYWAGVSGGRGFLSAGSYGAGETAGPVTAYQRNLSTGYPGAPYAWSAPAGRLLAQHAPAAPAGLTSRLGPVPPGAPTPQSAVQSSSPWLPAALLLPFPLAANSWLFGLSSVDPSLAVAAAGGSYIDVTPVSAETLAPETSY